MEYFIKILTGRCTLTTKKIGIVAFAFGTPESIFSNRLIAKIAFQKAFELKAPIYTQLDVSVGEGADVKFIEEPFNNPVTTLRIARGTVLWAIINGITELWVVAAKPHLWRCVRDLKGVAEEVSAQIEVLVCKETEEYDEYVWFCSNSDEIWTQSKKNWQRREWIINLIPFFIYKLIAS